MKPVSLIIALAFTAFGSTLAQNNTADASSSDVGKNDGNNGAHKGGGDGDGGDGGGFFGAFGHGQRNKHDGHRGKHGKHHNKHKGVNAGSTLEHCTMLQQFNKIIDNAANATKLQRQFEGNATRIARFKEEAAQLQNATSPKGAILANFRSNETFLGICDAIFATESSHKLCQRLTFLEERATISANVTLLSEASHGNITKQKQIQDSVTATLPELATLQNNATLQEFCANIQTRIQCREVKVLYDAVSLARNATRLNQTLEGNTTRIAAFQNQVAKATARLDMLLNNATLVSNCKTEMPFILDIANELPNATVTTTESVSQSAAVHNMAGSVLPLAVFLVLSFCLL